MLLGVILKNLMDQKNLIGTQLETLKLMRDLKLN